MSGSVVSKVENGVCLLELNRPEKLNALDREMRDALRSRLEEADRDGEVRVVILAGSGRAFCAGADLAEDADLSTSLEWYELHQDRDLLRGALRNMRKPVIAAVDGLCYGLGLILAAHCDFIIASKRAKFALLESRAGNAGSNVFPFLVGAQWTKFLILTGEVITAEKAKEISLVLEVFESDLLLERCESLARRIAAMPQHGVYLNKRAVDGTMDVIGWSLGTTFARSHASLIDHMADEATGMDGSRLADVLEKSGFAEYKQLRDHPFREPWLDGGCTA